MWANNGFGKYRKSSLQLWQLWQQKNKKRQQKNKKRKHASKRFFWYNILSVYKC